MWTPFRIAIRCRTVKLPKLGAVSTQIGIRLKDSNRLVEEWIHPDYSYHKDDYMEVVAQFKNKSDALSYFDDKKWKIGFELEQSLRDGD